MEGKDMALTNKYLSDVYAKVCERNKGESEFLQAVLEVLESFEPVVERRPDIVAAGVIDRARGAGAFHPVPRFVG